MGYEGYTGQRQKQWYTFSELFIWGAPYLQQSNIDFWWKSKHHPTNYSMRPKFTTKSIAAPQEEWKSEYFGLIKELDHPENVFFFTETKMLPQS